MKLTFLLGGVRAGKSARALQLAQFAVSPANADAVLFVATAQAFDDEMRRRITAHQAERPSGWQTLEVPLDVAIAIEQRLEDSPAIAVVVIDCITLWVSNLLLQYPNEDDIEQVVADKVRELLAVMSHAEHVQSGPSARPCHWIVVSNEVGLGIVPPTPLGRQYRDALGRANQLLAAAADDVRLLVAGIELPLKRHAAE